MNGKTTLDDLLEMLQAQKDSGMPGDTPIAFHDNDNNGKGGMANLDVRVIASAIAKDEFSKGYGLCRIVSRGGVKILMIC